MANRAQKVQKVMVQPIVSIYFLFHVVVIVKFGVVVDDFCTCRCFPSPNRRFSFAELDFQIPANTVTSFNMAL